MSNKMYSSNIKGLTSRRHRVAEIKIRLNPTSHLILESSLECLYAYNNM